MGIRRMTVDTWLELIEKEKALGEGHILPCGGNLPRPEERGGSDCAVCSRNRGILEVGGASGGAFAVIYVFAALPHYPASIYYQARRIL